MILDFIYSLLAFVLALLLPSFFLKDNEKQYQKPMQWLITYHFVFGVGYYLFTRGGGVDAYTYWEVAKKMSFSDFIFFITQSDGTRFMNAFNYIFANWLDMGFFANTMLFSFFGSLGLVFFFLLAVRLIPYSYKIKGFALFPVIFFLPNLHFWSAGVGKDTILFMCIGMFAYAIHSPAKRIPLLIISLFLSFAIRPHITLFMLVAFGLAYFLGGKLSLFRRIAFSIILIGASIAILPKVLDFINVETLTAEAIEARSATQVKNLTTGSGSAVDVSAYPFPLQVLTFMYRPLFFDAHTASALMSSFDNLLLLILTFLAFRHKLWKTFMRAPFIIKGFLILALIGTVAFAPTLGNLGIMVRQKNMFTPGLLIYFLWAFSCQTEEKYKGILYLLKLKQKAKSIKS